MTCDAEFYDREQKLQSTKTKDEDFEKGHVCVMGFVLGDIKGLAGRVDVLCMLNVLRGQAELMKCGVC